MNEWTCACVALLAVLSVTEGVRDVRLVLPLEVRSGSSVTLLCLYDLEGAPLYSVKWYRGRYEFYRYLPGEKPPGRLFPFPGIHVDLSASGARQVTLRAVPLHLSGVFSCEVSADAPSFSTAFSTDALAVIEYVSGRPELRVEESVLSGDQPLVVNCTSPAPRLEFYLNNQQVAEDLVVTWPNGATLQTSVNRGNFSAQGEMRIKCAATIAHTLKVTSATVSVWWEKTPGNDTHSGGQSIDKTWVWMHLNIIVHTMLVYVTATYFK